VLISTVAPRVFLDKSADWRRIVFYLLRIACSLMMPRCLANPFIVVVTVAMFALSACETLPRQGIPGEPGGDNTASAPQTSNRLAAVQTQLGIGYFRKGKLRVAFNRLTRALEADPNYSTAHNAMAALQERLGNTESAERHYRRAVELSPTDSASQSNFGAFLCRTGRYDDGEQRFLQALKNSLYERPEVAYSNAGLCMQTTGQDDKAETYFRSALEHNPRIPAALFGMAKISFDTGRFLPARAYLQRYQELSELNPRALWLGVHIERELGDKKSANRFATQLRRRYPDSPETQELDSTQ
jgi:type IV pilus assembly protein PilF